MNEIVAFVLGLLPSIIAGIVAFYVQRGQKRRDAHFEERSKARKRESLLSLELTMASAKLSYACAMALKRGCANGEVEDAVKDYDKAKHAYYEFMNDQAKEYIME